MMNQQDAEEGVGGGTGPNPAPSAGQVKRDGLTHVWSRVRMSHNSLVPPPRSGAASVVRGNKLYMFGGYGGGTGRLDDFYSFDFVTSAWEEVEVRGSMKPGCRENNGAVLSDSSHSIFLFGGYNGSTWLNDLWRFDIDRQEWTCIQESSDPLAADEANMAVGIRGGDVAGLNVNNRQRARIYGPSRRFGYVSVVHDNKLVLFGGFDGTRWLNDMWLFCFDGLSWREVSTQFGPSPRSCPAWACDGRFIYITGGYDGFERKADFWACDLQSGSYTWSEMASMGTPPSPRYFHSCCLYKGKMYLYGGYSGTQRLSDMHVYDFDTHYWSQVEYSPGENPNPSGRSSLVAQIHGTRRGGTALYCFGGYNGSTVLSDFFSFQLEPIGVPESSLVGDLQRLINYSDMSDVTFLVEGKEVYAHRAILAVRSEYFRALLFGHMRESVKVSNAEGGMSENGPAPIEIPDVSHDVFLQVLSFLYTDELKLPSRTMPIELGMSLLAASEQFLLDRLKALCEDLIRKEINADNVITVLVLSQRYNALALKDCALNFVLENLSQSSIQDGLAELKTEPDLLVDIIKLTSQRPRHSSEVPTIANQQQQQHLGVAHLQQQGNTQPQFRRMGDWDPR